MRSNKVHEEVIELLPWLVNESLSAKEQLRVTSHLKRCEICRKERDNLQCLQAVVTEDDSLQPDYHFAFRKLEARIEIAEANHSTVTNIPPAEGKSPKQVRAVRMRSWFSGLAIAASLIVGFLLGSGAENMNSAPESLSAQNFARTTPDVVNPSTVNASNVIKSSVTPKIIGTSDVSLDWVTRDIVSNVDLPLANLAGNNERFVTLASGNADDVKGVLHRVYLSFNPSVRAEAKRSALVETRAQIVSGPDQFGTYTVNMSIPVEQTDAEFIASIRQLNGVRYADYKDVSVPQSSH